ncbi:GNAT family N-acetyltransferase [Mycolicibacterium sp.]|uniref:GNAT family N-acetyltransferase n=1 Tax=Mycolicibacterium sp. TaxID=2320850 RepID=UPI001A2D84B3|nr:GNAT family N-acetyltransferase [Mycolicibacterium sp.]MBJ7341653.1 GNAT family N-acetyltransferase [Mycolicibacterium sp.]
MLVFRSVPSDVGDAAALVAAMLAEMRELYWDLGADGAGGLDLDAPDMPKAGPAELGPPDGVFLVGYRDGIPVCGGGLKRLPDGACEIKRMYVVPEARGMGVARQLLHALEDSARGLGYTLARLDTGPRQAHAQGLYEREGYLPVANFNDNPVATYFGEKQL